MSQPSDQSASRVGMAATVFTLEYTQKFIRNQAPALMDTALAATSKVAFMMPSTGKTASRTWKCCARRNRLAGPAHSSDHLDNAGADVVDVVAVHETPCVCGLSCEALPGWLCVVGPIGAEGRSASPQYLVPTFPKNGGQRPTRPSSIVSSSSVWLMTPAGTIIFGMFMSL